MERQRMERYRLGFWHKTARHGKRNWILGMSAMPYIISAKVGDVSITAAVASTCCAKE